MTRATSIGILSLLILAPAAGSQTIFAGKKGAELRARVRQEYTPNNPLNYNAARAVLFGTVENNGGKYELAYESHEVAVDTAHPIPNANGPGGINTEHTWPQSMFGHDDGPGMKTDLHHLFPVRSRPNAARGNKPFAELDDDTQTLRWWNGATPEKSKPAANRDAFAEESNSQFEPEEDHKGNVARAMVYFFTVYENEPALKKSFFLPQVATLRAWHVKDPADAREVDRGKRIELVQGNVNPFVLDATLLDRVLDDIAPVALAAGDSSAPAVPIGPGPVAAAATTDVIVGVSIVAVLPNPLGPDEGKESVTLANPTDAELDLAGWKLTDKMDREFALSGKLPPGETRSFRLADTEMVLANDGGEVSLVDNTGTRRQTVTYTRQQARAGSFILFGN